MTTSGKNIHKKTLFQKIAATLIVLDQMESSDARKWFAVFLHDSGIRGDALVSAMKQFDGFILN